MSKKLVAQFNAQGDSVIAGSVVARHLLSIQKGAKFTNEGISVFSDNVQINANLLVGETIFTDNIVEYTTGSGVTVEGVLLKNGMVSATALQGINVNALEPVNGQVLGFNGANWTPVDIGLGFCALRGVSVSAKEPLNGQVLQFDGTNWTPSTFTPSIPTTAVTGQILSFNGTNWQPDVVFPNGTMSLGSGAVPSASLLNQVTGIGYQALANATTGANGNTVLGYQTGNTITTGSNNVLIGPNADVMANMNSYGVAIGASARTNSRGVAIGNNAHTNSIITALALGENASPTDIGHAIALGINSASVSNISPTGETSYLGITINGQKYKIAIVSDLSMDP
jgi:hypothetical protein